MRKALLISLALVTVLAVAVFATEEYSITKPILADAVGLKNADNAKIAEPTPGIRHLKDDGIILDVPTNDDCSNAIEIGDVQDLLINANEATVDGGNLSVFRNIWFLYTASTTGRMRIDIDDPENQLVIAPNIAVYDGSTCPEYVEIPASVLLDGGEDIESATPITDPLPVSYYSDMEGLHRDYSEECSCMYSWDQSGPDAVYSYTAETDGEIDIILTSPDNDMGIVIMNEDANELACSYWNNYYDDTYGEGPTIYSFPVTGGETYYIVASDNSNNNANYYLTIYPTSTTILNRTMTLGKIFHLYFDAIAGEQYLLEVSYNHERDTSSTYLSIAPAPERPVNDDCAGALDGGILTAGLAIELTGDNTGATIGCEMVEPVPEVWIKFTLEDTLDVSVDFCGTVAMANSGYYLSYVLADNCPHSSSAWVFSIAESVMWECPTNSATLLWWQGLPPGTYYYPFFVMDSYEGEYVINVKAATRQVCNDSSIFSQPPAYFFNFSSDCLYSDLNSQYAVADKFAGTDDGITRVNWWGIYFSATGEEICQPENPAPFQIVFCNYSNSSPYIPLDTIAVYDVLANWEETNYAFPGMGNARQIKFMVDLPETLYIDDGWVMIQSSHEADGCMFAWETSGLSGAGAQYDRDRSQWASVPTCLAFCLESDVISGIDDQPTELPLSYELIQNYPNPFNATTSIRFSLEKADDVSVSIFDVGGRLIKSLHSGALYAGSHSLIWDGTNESGTIVSSGIYFCRLNTSEGSFSNRMVFLK